MKIWKHHKTSQPRHSNTHARVGAMLTTGALVVLSGCGGSNNATPQTVEPPPVVQGLLIPVDSDKTITDKLISGFVTLAPAGESVDINELLGSGDNALVLSPILNSPAQPSDSATTYSTTYTQEADVDEFDAVKYDGERLFVAPRRACCNSLAAPTVALAQPGGIPPIDERAIRVLVTDPDNAGVAETARIPLAENTSVQGMFLHNNRLAALTSETFFGGWGDQWLSIAPWQNQENGIVLYDVSDNANPEQVWEASLDGSLIDSRRIDNRVYLFTRYSPFLNDLVYQPTTEEQRQANEDLLANSGTDALLPKIRINGTEQTLIDPADCLVTNTSSDAAGRNTPDQNGDDTIVAPPSPPVLTLITAIDINNPDTLQTLCYNEAAYGLYASNTSVYFIELLTGNEPNSQHTRIHKFSLQELAYTGSAEVQGLLWSGGQSDFRASEHNGDLRIITSRNTNDPDDRVDHELHILRPAANRPELERIATLPNADQPAEIGKPNESLYGVRFFGERAYAVTFLQTDPLYALDLTDPLQPTIAGELEITGFSDFLHPVNADLLLGFGVGEDQGLKLELFDVSDLATPRSLAVERLGGPFSFSEARFDRHAFTYLPDVTRGDVTVDRFAIPADLYAEDESFKWVESGLYLYEIGNTDTPLTATLTSAGAMVFDTPTVERSWPIGGRYRSILDKDAVYLIRNEDVFSAFWNSPDSITGPL